MNSYFRNSLAFLIAIVLGSLINISLITISSSIIPPPPGTDLTTEEGLIKAMPLMEVKHFIFPFLAHALGTFFGAGAAFALATKNWSKKLAYSIGIIFFGGGVMSCFLIPAPVLFITIDLLFAYFPMVFLGINIVKVIKK